LPEARQAQPFDLDLWRQWEGQSVAWEFVLERCVGGSTRSAVFETQFQGRSAAIKLIPGTSASVSAQLRDWEKAANISHSALVQRLARGETNLADTPCAYIVMERAEESLAEVLAERALTPTETTETLLPVLGALQYLEAQGYSHGRLQPANILAFGDQVKISSDSLTGQSDSATDCRAIGVLIREVLGGKVPAPFAEIVSGCLTPDAAERWDLARIEKCLRGEAEPGPGRSKLIGWGVAAVAVIAVSMFAFWPKPGAVPPPVQAVVPAPAATEEKPSAAIVPLAETKPVQETKRQDTKKPETKNVEETKPVVKESAAILPALEQEPPGSDGMSRVLPEISQQALGTITGRVRINVRIHVDASGNVSQATLQPPAASKYFTDRVLAAAQAWKFPAGNEVDWVLHFELTRARVRVSPVKTAN
jgi:serine/threonine protein kinase